MIRAFDETGLSLCKVQGRIFEKSAVAAEGSSPFFIKSFMFSDEAEHMDNDGFLSEPEDVESILENLKRKHNLNRGTIKYSGDALFWMGYLYRFCCYTYQMSSRSVYGIIKAEELHSLYLPYHTLDIGVAVRRILEAKGITSEKSSLECLKKAYRGGGNQPTLPPL